MCTGVNLTSWKGLKIWLAAPVKTGAVVFAEPEEGDAEVGVPDLVEEGVAKLSDDEWPGVDVDVETTLATSNDIDEVDEGGDELAPGSG